MQFVLAKEYTFWWPVTVLVPSEQDPGAFDERQLEAHFRALPEERVAELAAQARKGDAGDIDVLKEAVTDWRGVAGPDGKDVPFSADAFSQALGFLPFRAGLVRAYAEAMHGRAKEKN